jgi:Fic family protein
MTYTEVKKINSKKYYYRARSIREGRKVNKKRIYLGSDITKKQLRSAELEADLELGVLSSLLDKSNIAELKKIKKEYSKHPEITYENRYEAFISLFTHNSTAIEGNTLTLQETASLIFEERTPAFSSMKDIIEVLNHKKAVDFILNYDGDVTRDFICELHEHVMKDTLSVELNSQIGRYRDLQVFIRGVDWTPPGPRQVPMEMKNLLTWYTKNKRTLHPVLVAAYFHAGFETVHPFIDGNGRVGRLLLNFILHRNGYPMVNIPFAIRDTYYEVLHEAQVNSDLKPFLKFLTDLMKENKIMI